MGAPFHFIAIANGLLAVFNFMDIPWGKQRFLIAVVAMLDSLLLLTLFNRFYWEDYFKRERNLIDTPHG